MKKIIIICVLSYFAISSYAIITGPQTVFVGNTYSYLATGMVENPQWTCWGGTIVSTNEKTAQIRWTSVGNQSVFFRDGVNSPQYSLPVKVVALPIAKNGTNNAVNGFTANWNSVPGAAYYLLDVSRYSSFSPCLTGYNNLQVLNTSQAVTNLWSATTYYYRVRAVINNGGGTSQNSNIITTGTIPIAPDIPGGYVYKTTPYTFTVKWSSVDGANGYYLDVSSSREFSYDLVVNNLKITGQSTNSWTVTVSQPCPDVYHYRVRAYNAYGISVNSVTAGAIPVTSGWKPEIRDPTSVTSSSFIANWGTALTCTHWRFQVSTNLAFDPEDLIYDITDLPFSTTSYAVYNLNILQLQTFYYRVLSDYSISDPKTVNLPQSKSTVNMVDDPLNSNKNNLESYTIYPNPVSDRLYFTGMSADKVSIRICSIDGVTLKLLNQNLTGGIDVQDLKPGTYLLKVYDDEKPVTLFFIKQ